VPPKATCEVERRNRRLIESDQNVRGEFARIWYMGCCTPLGTAASEFENWTLYRTDRRARHFALSEPR
jgi:hypothetical protein